MEDAVFGMSEAEDQTTARPDSPTADEALGYEEGKEPSASDRPEGPDNGHPSQVQPAQSDKTDGQPEGERLLAGKYRTVQDLEQGYLHLQSKLGQQALELGRLRQENQLLEMLRQQGYQIPYPGQRQGAGVMQASMQALNFAPFQQPPAAQYTPQQMAPYTPPDAPHTPPAQMPTLAATMPQTLWNQYTAANMAGTPSQPQAQPTPTNKPAQTPQSAQKLEPEDEDPQEWLDRLYQQGPKLIRQMIQDEAMRILNEQGAIFGQGLSQILAPVFETTAQLQYQRAVEQWKTIFDAQAEELKKEVDDFDDLREEMANVIKRNPHILYSLDPQGKPNGLHVAYLIAKSMASQNGNAQAVKKAARMPSSSGAIVPKKDEREALVDAALGSLEGSGGVFG